MSWISGNRYLNEDEMKNNALMIESFLTSRGWSVNAIAGMLGNMEAESTINPGIWQSLNEGNMSGGYGLVQWTPATNYINWADSKGYSRTDGDAQLIWIDEETVPFGQWIPTTSYPLSFASFKTSLENPEYLASAFLKNFERAGVEVEEQRRNNANKWYNYITGNDPPTPPTPTPGIRRKRKNYNFVLFRKRRWLHQ